jgi:hypothetical protein
MVGIKGKEAWKLWKDNYVLLSARNTGRLVMWIINLASLVN